MVHTRPEQLIDKLCEDAFSQRTFGFIHSDCVVGDPTSLSDARLKKVTPISGAQPLSVLNHIRGCTYDRDDLNNERQLCSIADEVESAIQPLEVEKGIQ